MTLGFTGDLFLGSAVDPEVFRRVSQQLGDSVRLVANFEGTLYDRRENLQPKRQKILLDSPVEAFSAVKQLPIAMLCAGNNHIGDYGNEIAQYTLNRASESFPTFGAGYSNDPFHRAFYRDREIAIGFVNYCTADSTPLFTTPTRIGPRPLTLSRAEQDLKSLRETTPLCVAIVHWGLEDFHHPRPAQVRLGRKLIDMGFNLVIGHHPHTVQGYEKYKHGWIFYSLGNFYFPDHHVMFDGNRHSVQWMRRRSWGLIPLFDVAPNKIDLADVKIVGLGRNKAPYISSSARLRAKLDSISADLSAVRYWSRYRVWSRREEFVTRIEEFLNNENKAKSVFKKVQKLIRLKAA